jgi:hypothetical protein
MALSMRALADLWRKLLRVLTGADEPAPGSRPFQWEPSGGSVVLRKKKEAAVGDVTVPAASALAEAPLRRPPEPSAVIGGGLPADVADFALVYKAAAVQAPAHGYGVDRVAAMLQHKSLAGLDRGVKASAVLAALDSASVPLHDVVHDGLLRYKALVAFEAAKELELHQLGPRNELRAEELKHAIQAFQKKKQAEIEALMRETAAAAAAITRLKTRQRVEEERFHRTVSLFAEPLPPRVVPMVPKPAEPPAPATTEARPELRLVPAARPDEAKS